MKGVSKKHKESFEAFLELWRKYVLLRSIGGVLGWDQETVMPKDGLALRVEQHQIMSGLAHEALTNDALYRYARTLENATDAGELSGEASAAVKVAFRLIERERRVPASLVGSFARHTAEAHAIWQQAKAQSDFSVFRPALARTIQFCREIADAIGYEREPYEALFSGFEPDLSIADVDRLFAELRQELVPYAQELLDRPNQPDAAMRSAHYPIAGQEALARYAIERMGYDFSKGQMAVSAHPFTCGFSHDDVRITIRYDELDFAGSLMAAIHEAGHALFEQGVNPAYFGTPIGAVYSLGLHESQSRFWEVWVGRSFEFCAHLWPAFATLFPDAARGRAPKEFYGAVNKPRRSLIRVEADPVTYNLHVLLRYELERRIFRNEIAVDDLPEQWNALMREYVGIEPPNDAQGVLQDIHWAMGGFGYFPTYALGTMASAAIWRAARDCRCITEEMLRAGDLLSLREWLRQNIHQHGNRFGFLKTLKRIGVPLSASIFMEELKTRMEDVYERAA